MSAGPGAEPVRVFIADDSSFFREVLKEVLEQDGTLTVVGEADDGAGLVEQAALARAQVVTVDLSMRGTGGLEAIEELMARFPVPILVLTAQRAGPSSGVVFEATRRGALDVAEKRVVDAGDGGASLRALLRQLATVRVVQRPRASARPRELRPAPALRPPVLDPGCRVVGVGASAGGPPAVAALLGALPAELPACVAVVQHLSPGFDAAYVQFLKGATRLRVELARDGAPIEPGLVLVAPDGAHLVSRAAHFELRDAPPDEGHRPSVSRLLGALAVSHGPAAVGVVLSGMGQDGAAGAAALAASGGRILAQDESSAAVWGMPRATLAAVPSATALPLAQLGSALEAALAPGRRR